MINLEIIGCLEDDAEVMRNAQGEPTGIEFTMTMTRFDNSAPKHHRVTYTHIHCVKKGCCAADARFVRGQKVYVRGDIHVGKNNMLETNVWQFELM